MNIPAVLVRYSHSSHRRRSYPAAGAGDVRGSEHMRQIEANDLRIASLSTSPNYEPS